jgi:hypothetical protein
MDLLGRSHLLSLLEEHAAIQARIVDPDDRIDPAPDD